jgi:hypothetical protein
MGSLTYSVSKVSHSSSRSCDLKLTVRLGVSLPPFHVLAIADD